MRVAKELRSGFEYYTILYSTLLYSTLLYCTVLILYSVYCILYTVYYTILYYTVQYTVYRILYTIYYILHTILDWIAQNAPGSNCLQCGWAWPGASVAFFFFAPFSTQLYVVERPVRRGGLPKDPGAV